MAVMERQHQVYQHNDQLVHGLFHVFYVYELYNHESSKECQRLVRSNYISAFIDLVNQAYFIS